MQWRFKRSVFIVLGPIVYLGITIAAYGAPLAFFADPARLAATVVFVALMLAATFTEGNLSTGRREDRGNRWVIPALGVIGLLGCILPAWSDRADVWTFGGEGVRWLGVVLFALGGALRLWPVFVLGRRFSGLVAIQEGHELVTTGIFAVIRNPSYLGLVVNMLGWGLVFRSILGVILTLAALIPLVGRIRAEERLLASEFGAAYEAYRARTWRLVPWLY
ncbi:MAG: isoprenylcysteine carboxylmethyltransferase family protein [Ancalomicrobiaceae bacterium]|nr:isoprenylcysteine carboxylmethyltransferase family protein [Ancalomicrobiaceae bacterium]